MSGPSLESLGVARLTLGQSRFDAIAIAMGRAAALVSPAVLERCAATALFFLNACGGPLAQDLAKPPDLNIAGQSKCKVTGSQARPLIVEWPAPSASRTWFAFSVRGSSVPSWMHVRG